jgi:hypothetical protein
METLLKVIALGKAASYWNPKPNYALWNVTPHYLQTEVTPTNLKKQ